jgi:hypothetical protein
MQTKKLILLVFLILCSWKSNLNAQNLVVKLNNGTQNSELLNTVKKLSFANGDLLVSFKTGIPDSYSLAEIQKLYFGLETSVPDLELNDENKLSIYPNPVNQTVTIQNILAGTSELKIFRMDGKLVLLTSEISETETLDLGNLPAGIYLLIAKNQSVKFIKL